MQLVKEENIIKIKNILQSKKTERPFRILKKIKHEKIIKEDNNEEYDILFY